MQKPEAQRQALLLGATGLVGGHCLRYLLDSDLYTEVVVVTRRKIPLVHSRLRQLVLPDFGDLETGLDGVVIDDFFCCLGTTMAKARTTQAFRRVDYGYPLLAARLLRKQGASHCLVVSAVGADPSSRFFYNRVKGELERDLALLEYPYLSVFRPSLLSGERNETRLLEGLSNRLGRLVAPLMIGPLARVRPIPAEKVARSLVTQARLVAGGVRRKQLLVVDSAAMQQESV